jgi:hypothetical protein
MVVGILVRQPESHGERSGHEVAADERRVPDGTGARTPG